MRLDTWFVFPSLGRVRVSILGAWVLWCLSAVLQARGHMETVHVYTRDDEPAPPPPSHPPFSKPVLVCRVSLSSARSLREKGCLVQASRYAAREVRLPTKVRRAPVPSVRGGLARVQAEARFGRGAGLGATSPALAPHADPAEGPRPDGYGEGRVSRGGCWVVLCTAVSRCGSTNAGPEFRVSDGSRWLEYYGVLIFGRVCLSAWSWFVLEAPPPPPQPHPPHRVP